jgi:hypothetical protein
MKQFQAAQAKEILTSLNTALWTIPELQKHLSQYLNCKISTTAIRTYLQNLKLPYKSLRQKTNPTTKVRLTAIIARQEKMIRSLAIAIKEIYIDCCETSPHPSIEAIIKRNYNYFKKR